MNAGLLPLLSLYGLRAMGQQGRPTCTMRDIGHVALLQDLPTRDPRRVPPVVRNMEDLILPAFIPIPSGAPNGRKVEDLIFYSPNGRMGQISA